jgi:hypothetical protein
MNNFSDLLDIDRSIDIQIQLQPVTDNGNPDCEVVVNGVELYRAQLCQPLTLTTTAALTGSIDVCISMSNKQYHSQRETAIIIQRLDIDGFAIVPQWAAHATYRHDHNSTDASCYLGFNGVWQLKIDQPFYIWKHHVTSQGWLLQPS